MFLYPEDILSQIGFDKIIERLASFCHGDAAKDRILSLKPHTDLELIEKSLSETAEVIDVQKQGGSIPMAHYENIEEYFNRITVEDYVLEEEGFRRILRALRIFEDLRIFFSEERSYAAPGLYKAAKKLGSPDKLLKSIGKVFDKKGEIRDNASADLGRIQNMIRSKMGELDRTFRQLANQFRTNGWVKDTVESFRNGRRVFSVPAEHKRKIKGIIHDESSSGKTVFLEPVAIADINNEIFNLHQDRKREIRKILKVLTASLGEEIISIQQWYNFIISLDTIQSRAALARAMQAHKPAIQEDPLLHVKAGKHPLLIMKNADDHSRVVPYDLVLHPPNRILVVSGPNAGGKSVLLKSIGLQQCMLQAGLHIPCDPDSTFGLFEKIFADIGDQQSIENDLSTYSSHLSNMKKIAEYGDDKSLVLIDEFGSGTDPKSGGAIAESVLRHLNGKQIFGLVTTHYSNLKMYAYKTKGIVNGGLLFDMESLKPTYQLQIGKPGSSFAFEIARQVGLDMRLLNFAKKRLGKGERKVDELLISLQKEKQEIEEKLALVREQEKQIRQIRKNFDHLSQELDIKRKKIKIEQKETILQIQARETGKLENLIRELKERNKLEEARLAIQNLKKEREALIGEVHEIKKELHVIEGKGQKVQPLQLGDFVKIRSGTAHGKIKSLRKGKATIEMGMITLDVHLHELEKISEPLQIQSNRSIQTDTVQSMGTFRSKIDIRGLRKTEAIEMMDEYLDKAFMSGVSQLTIVHGKGNGVLKEAVIKKLREFRQIKSWGHPEEEHGGGGSDARVVVVTCRARKLPIPCGECMTQIPSPRPAFHLYQSRDRDSKPDFH